MNEMTLAASACAFAELDAGVDVFGVLAEDDDVEFFRVLHGAGDAGVVLHGADALVEIHQLAQGDVERTNAAADGRGEGSFDGDAEVDGGLDGVIGQPVLGFAVALFAGEDFVPLDGALAAVGFGYRCVEYALGGFPDVAAGAIAFDEGDDGVVGHGVDAVGVLDWLAVGGDGDVVIAGLHG